MDEIEFTTYDEVGVSKPSPQLFTTFCSGAYFGPTPTPEETIQTLRKQVADLQRSAKEAKEKTLAFKFNKFVTFVKSKLIHECNHDDCW